MKTERENGIVRQVNTIQTKEERFNPFSWYEDMRNSAPVQWDEERQVWDVFHYDGVKEVLEQKNIFSSDRRPPQNQRRTALGTSLINIDPPKHAEMRGLVNKAFTPKAMKAWEPKIARITNELLQEVEHLEDIDIVEHLSYPLPVMVIADILGVPIEDQRQFKDWSDIIVAGPSNNERETLEKLQQEKMKANDELETYFYRIIEEKRTHPGDDIISVLLQAKEEGKQLTDEEIVGFSILLLIAGNETTTNLISNTIYCLMEDKASFERLKREKELLPSAIEEVLRYRSPVQALHRIVKEDVILAGKKLKAGEHVIPWMGSAHRDAQYFEKPDVFKIDRKPNVHMAFGRGIHFCLGAPLARIEAKIMLSELIDRYPQMDWSPSFELKPIESTFVYGLKELLIRKHV
ncbi:cytochrome P450 [Priestia megaterium]|uniref:cytochrome P450 n=1 Tax=Priestia megaterium TaxID=1404 RepID=UPI002A6AF322|nr:cytochrome P450 [Priestia megaterium]MDY0938542.1 cytochrome P450 [Priestia megaterium]